MARNGAAANRARPTVGQPRSAFDIISAKAQGCPRNVVPDRRCRKSDGWLFFAVFFGKLTASDASHSAESLTRRWYRRTMEQPGIWLFHRCFSLFLSRQVPGR
jgi:hypothetical protein